MSTSYIRPRVVTARAVPWSGYIREVYLRRPVWRVPISVDTTDRRPGERGRSAVRAWQRRGRDSARLRPTRGAGKQQWLVVREDISSRTLLW